MKMILFVVALAMAPGIASATVKFKNEHHKEKSCAACHGADKKVANLTEAGKGLLGEFCKTEEGKTKDYCKDLK